MGDGWIKDGDFNSTFSKTVLPLPYHAKDLYVIPPGKLEDEWVYKQHPEDWQKISHSLCDPSGLPKLFAEPITQMSGRRVARIILTLVFVGLIASPVIMKRLAARREVAQANADARSSLARHGFYLQEVSEASGINFVHQSPALDPKLERIMPEVASMGAGVSIVDFDRDWFL